MNKILIVDDEQDIIDFIKYNLIKEGFEVVSAQNGEEAIEIAMQENFDLIILDVMMPKIDGIETCIEIRKLENHKNTIITFLTARGEDYSQIAGFEAGGDDYIVKPIKPKVLVYKIKSLLKREMKNNDNSQNSNDFLPIGDILIDKERYIAIKNNEKIYLPKKEFELLELLVSNRGKVVERKKILKKIWGESIVIGDRTIDVHIRYIRKKIGDKYIKTIKGVGYKYE